MSDTPIVDVEESTILLPAVKLLTGEVRKVFHAVVEAVSGIEYPGSNPTEKVWIPLEVAEEMSTVRTPEDEVAKV